MNGEEMVDLTDDQAIPDENEGDNYDFTDPGAQTEIYVDDGDQTVTVVEINYYLGQVSHVDEEDGTVTIREVSDLSADTSTYYDGADLDDRTFATTEFADEDYVVYTIDENSDGDSYICEMMAPETVTGEVTRVDWGSGDRNDYLYLDDESRYDYAREGHMAYDLNNENDRSHPTLDEEYTLYLDPNGFVLAYSGDTTVNYLYVRDSDEEFDDWEAAVTFTDATRENIVVDEVNDEESDVWAEYLVDAEDDNEKADYGRFTCFDDFQNDRFTQEDLSWLDRTELTTYNAANTKVSNLDYQIWEYSVNDDGDLYALEYVTNWYKKEADIHNGDSYIDLTTENDEIVIDRNTIFVNMMDDVAYTGFDEVPDIEDASIVYVQDINEAAEVVFILDGIVQDADKIYFTLANDAYDTVDYDRDEYYFFDDDGLTVDGSVRNDLVVSVDDFYGDNGIFAQLGIAANRNSRTSVDAAFETLIDMGVVFRVDQTEDESYIVTFAPETDWSYARVVGEDALRLVKNNQNSDIFHTDGDTVIVLMEAIYDGGNTDYDVDEWDVSSVGDLDDIITGIDEDGWTSQVQVLKADGQYAELIYIKNYKALTDTEIGPVSVKGVTANFTDADNDGDYEADVTVTATQNATSNAPKLDLGTVPYGANTYVEISGVNGEWTEADYGDEGEFTTPGERTITIEVTTEDGEEATYTINLTINAGPVPVEITVNIGDSSNATIDGGSGRP